MNVFSLLRKFLGWFLRPWEKKVLFLKNPLFRSVVVGLAASFLVLASVWTFFSSSDELNGRSVSSVLVNPDERVRKATIGGWRVTGRCVSSLPMPTLDNSYEGSSECRDWQRDPNGLSWSATRYTLEPTMPKMKFGNSRQDALMAIFNTWWSAVLRLLVPLVVLFGLQFGIATGYSYFRKQQHLED